VPVLTLFVGMAAGTVYRGIGVAATMFVTGLVAVVFTVASSILVERGFMRFRPLRPRYCSIYDPSFWWHERYWEVCSRPVWSCSTGHPSRAWSGGWSASGWAGGCSTTDAASLNGRW